MCPMSNIFDICLNSDKQEIYLYNSKLTRKHIYKYNLVDRICIIFSFFPKYMKHVEYLLFIYEVHRHERDQSFLVPIPAKKKFSSRFRSRREIVLGLGPGFGHGPGPDPKKFWCRSQRDRDHFAHL
jgi:hypothetical protein